MESDGKFYGLSRPESFKRDLEKNGFELKRYYANNYGIHYSGINDTPFGFLLNDEFLLICNDKSKYVGDEKARLKRKNNFNTLDKMIKESDDSNYKYL